MIIYSDSKKKTCDHPQLCRLPERIILPTSLWVMPFRLHVAWHEVDLDELRLFADLFEAICYEEEAELALEAFIWEIAHDLLGGDEERHDRFAEKLLPLGRGILHQLKIYRLYQAGHLFHQFDHWVGNDILLGDFSRKGGPV